MTAPTRTFSSTRCSITLLAAFLTSTVLANAHENDPKGIDMEPRFEGSGWRESEGGLAGNYDSSGMTLRSWITISEMDNGSSAGNDCWGYVSPSGREYAIMGLSSGTSFVEITNPGNPQVLAFIDGPNSTWRDIKTYGTYAYAVSEGGGGIQVIDLSGIDDGTVSLVNSVNTGGNGQTHNVVLNEESGFLYRVGGGSNYGLRIYDLNQDPVDPPYVGELFDFYVHDAQVVSYTEGPYAGLEVAFCCAGLNSGSTETGLYVVNVTDKSNPVLMRKLDYPNGAYSHQGWLTPDRQYFLLGDELNASSTEFSTLHVINVSNPYQPAYVLDWKNSSTAITHNLYTTDSFGFIANYTSGLRVFDLRDPLDMREVGYFDTYPGGDGPSFDGLWSCYPYFPSGTVIGSDIQRGLFVMTPDLADIGFKLPDGPPRTIESFGGILEVELDPLVTDVDTTSVLVQFDDGSGPREVPATQVEGTRYRAVLPDLACPSDLDFVFMARNLEGEQFQSEGFSTLVADEFPIILNSDFESNAEGWSVTGDAVAAFEGRWMRGYPIPAVGGPSADYDQSGRCYVTGNGADLCCDVDELTILVSPRLDASGGDAFLSYARWFSNGEGPWPGQDVLEVEISDDDGASWTLLEVVGPEGDEVNGGWFMKTFRIDAFVEPTSTVRVRFVANDPTTDSVIEAAIDRVAVEVVVCNEDVPGDLDGDGLVAGSDLSILLGFWGDCPDEGLCVADLDSDGQVSGSDLAIILGLWAS
jgi:choice-of-anchor B domain-containing protein